ncbi:MAG: lysophospholipid acyltransferase family protein [Lachnospiraceae bacterium]|nr:lysophospholipid acyltransferase family protein [Lachnospiraceae bacterium]
MIRVILVALTLVLFLIFSIPVILFENVRRKSHLESSRRQSLSIVQFMFRLILKISGVKVKVEGWENIPKDQAVLYVGNHRSYFDILVGYTTVPGLMGFVAKKEMEQIPLLKNWMDLVECLFLDRKNIKEGLKTILAGIEKVKNGISIWIFPEGTRNKHADRTELLPFKEGSLKIAEKSGCPVIPVAITGTADVFEKHVPFIRPHQVTVRYGKPIYLKTLPPEQKKHSGAYTREVIIGMLKDMDDMGEDR